MNRNIGRLNNKCLGFEEAPNFRLNRVNRLNKLKNRTIFKKSSVIWTWMKINKPLELEFGLCTPLVVGSMRGSSEEQNLSLAALNDKNMGQGVGVGNAKT